VQGCGDVLFWVQFGWCFHAKSRALAPVITY
jgi:hypothetical protein